MKKILCALLCALFLFSAFAERGIVVIYESCDETESAALPFEGVKIGIDPGHQAKGNNDKEPVAPGSKQTKAKVATGTRGVKSGSPEHEVNLQVSLLLRDILTALGAEVLMTRETADVNISNAERAIMMNEWGADAVVRIHCNGSTKSEAHGMGMYVRATGAEADESYLLAQYLLSAMKNKTSARGQGVFKRDSYTGLNWSEVPCVLIEMGYMTNPEEDLLLNDPGYQEKLALGIAEGLSAYFEAEKR